MTITRSLVKITIRGTPALGPLARDTSPERKRCLVVPRQERSRVPAHGAWSLQRENQKVKATVAAQEASEAKKVARQSPGRQERWRSGLHPPQALPSSLLMKIDATCGGSSCRLGGGCWGHDFPTTSLRKMRHKSTHDKSLNRMCRVDPTQDIYNQPDVGAFSLDGCRIHLP